jgi:hypothetical protein
MKTFLKLCLIVALAFGISVVSFGCIAPSEEELLGSDTTNAQDDAQDDVEDDSSIGENEDALTWWAQWWKALGQWSRNNTILNRAKADNGKYVGLNCKNWARKVVSDASKGTITIPATCPGETGWYWCGSSKVQNMGSIWNAQPGNVVQMNLPGPHTAIVSSNIGGNICWIDSNYKLDKTVRIHCQTVAAFLKMVTINGQQKYTVYQITGG